MPSQVISPSLNALGFANPIVDPGATMEQDDTMSLRNPQWARWFDAIKQAAGGKAVKFGPQGGINDLPTSPNGPGFSSLEYGNGQNVEPFSQGVGAPSLDALEGPKPKPGRALRGTQKSRVS